MNFRNVIGAAAFGLLVPSASIAQTCPAIEGFGDLEGLPIYQGACLFGAEDAGFAAYGLPIGPMKGRALGDTLALEGQLQRRLYVAPEGASAFDLFSNYRNALTDAGYETLFECVDRACGSNNALLGKLVIYGPDRTLRNLGAASEFALYIKGDEHFLAAKSADGTRHVAVYVAQNQDRPISGQAAGRAAVHIDLMSTDQLQNNMVDAAAMAKGITEDGHIALDNVYFDFGTAKLTPEAAPALAEMVKLLADNPALKVYIVGHTDWVGDAGANQTLSNQRAQAVVDALVAAGVDGARLGAAGMGMFSPRASNASEAGRALNRRVELVERPD
jgi:outer membrane protein OmpA-like peptidoglycan-associated protein